MQSALQSFLVDTLLPLAIMAAVLIALSAWLVRLVLFFAYRVRHRRVPNPHQNKETMGLPKGAMRTFLALVFTSMTALVILDGTTFVGAQDKKWLLGELGAIIAFYFGSRAIESYVDSRAKLRAIEKAESFDEARRLYSDENTSKELEAPDPGGSV